MGCDIHVRVEARRSTTGGHWFNADLYTPQSKWGSDVAEIFEGRNYDLFAILANVRNNGRITPISDPRGIPEDINEDLRSEIDSLKDEDGHFYDYHSFSYFTLKELLEVSHRYHGIEESGMITAKQAEELDSQGIVPQSYCTWTNDKEYVHREWVREYNPLEALLDDALFDRAKRALWCYTREQVIEKAEDFRIVFWFDN